MKKAVIVFGLLFTICAFSKTVYANEKKMQTEKPWKKFSFSVGGFFNAMDSSVRIGTKNIGLEVDVEDALGFDTTTAVFRMNTFWRFKKNLRHRLDLSWFAIRRDGSKTLLEDFEIGDTEFPVNTVIESNFDIDVFRAGYSYSFFQDERMDLAVAGGLYIMPISFKISASGVFEGEEKADITAPLPTLGLRLDYSITPKWFLRNHFGVFYLQISDYRGGIMSGGSAIEWQPFKHVGLGLGFEYFRLGIEAENDSNYPGIDFSGSIKFHYFGAQLFVKMFF